jgi:Fe-S cluster assembly ATPase SufC
MYDGQIIQSGGPELATLLEEEGYDNLIKSYEAAEKVPA